MRQEIINLYDFDELSDDAKLKALDDHNNNGDSFDFLSENLTEYLSQLLEENKVKALSDDKLFYSLGYCQGDGVCFVGNFEYKGVCFRVEQQGHYYHSNSVNIKADEIENDNDDDLKADLIEVLQNEAEAEFNSLYKEICDKIEKSGYEEIEYEQSEEYFKESCEANEYTFEVNGTMRNF